MFDHVTSRAADRAASEEFSALVLATPGAGRSSSDRRPQGEVDIVDHHRR